MRILIFAFVSFILSTAAAATANVSHERECKPAFYSSSQAECEKLGLRLPTAREVAGFAAAFGARIVKVSDYPENLPVGYKAHDFYLVSVINPGNVTDSFYFSMRDFEGGMDSNCKVWTSSRDPKHPTSVGAYFDQLTGELDWLPLSFGLMQGSVYCVAE